MSSLQLKSLWVVPAHAANQRKERSERLDMKVTSHCRFMGVVPAEYRASAPCAGQDRGIHLRNAESATQPQGPESGVAVQWATHFKRLFMNVETRTDATLLLGPHMPASSGSSV